MFIWINHLIRLCSLQIVEDKPTQPIWQISATRQHEGNIGRFLWGLLRLPALIVVLYLCREPLLSVIERAFDIIGITLYTLALVSTLVTRGIIFLAIILVLLAFWMLLTRRFSPVVAYISMVTTTAVLLLVAFRFLGTSRLFALLAVLILATNLVPDQLLAWFPPLNKLLTRFIAIGVGVAEVFFFRRYLEWLLSSLRSEAMPRRTFTGILGVLPGLLLMSGVVAVTLDYDPLIPVEQAIRMPAQASIMDSGDFNWIELDNSGQHLYVTGHGVDHLLRFDLAHPEAAPLESEISSGGAQGFAYDPEAGEIYVYNVQTKELLYFDATTLKLKRSLPLPDVSPGDPWIVLERQSNTITIVSEADVRTGSPFIVLDRSTGEILDRRDLDAGNFLIHPDKPIIYLSFFRNSTSLTAYDLEQREVVGEVTTDARVDRMAYSKEANEVLLASPIESQVLRFDADTLQPKGSLDTIFGVRVLAVDPVRNLLLCGSLATGTVAVFDLATGQQQASFYLGPWLRTITLDPNGGIAYVSANGALYKLNYGTIN